MFARAKLDEGLSVFAGTINPHLPRRLIPSACIQAWLGGERDSTSPPHEAGLDERRPWATGQTSNKLAASGLPRRKQRFPVVCRTNRCRETSILSLRLKSGSRINLGSLVLRTKDREKMASAGTFEKTAELEVMRVAARLF
ncbi:hypothetical protein ACVIIV_005566 [Bradyrhizobium sp. USDA 4354]